MAEQEWGWFYARSDDAERFHAANSREDAVARGAEYYCGEPFHICEARRVTLRDDFFRADRVCEEFEEFNEEAWGEDGPDGTITPEAERELEAALAAAFAAWREKHKPYTPWSLTDFQHGETITPAVEPIST